MYRWLAFVLMVFVCGCAESTTIVLTPTDPPEVEVGESAESGKSAESDAADIELTTVNAHAIMDELAKHKGKVILLDMWASW